MIYTSLILMTMMMMMWGVEAGNTGFKPELIINPFATLYTPHPRPPPNLHDIQRNNRYRPPRPSQRHGVTPRPTPPKHHSHLRLYRRGGGIGVTKAAVSQGCMQRCQEKEQTCLSMMIFSGSECRQVLDRCMREHCHHRRWHSFSIYTIYYLLSTIYTFILYTIYTFILYISSSYTWVQYTMSIIIIIMSIIIIEREDVWMVPTHTPEPVSCLTCCVYDMGHATRVSPSLVSFSFQASSIFTSLFISIESNTNTLTLWIHFLVCCWWSWLAWLKLEDTHPSPLFLLIPLFPLFLYLGLWLHPTLLSHPLIFITPTRLYVVKPRV